MFIDQVIIDVSGGNGGNGCVAWRREKGIRWGGPEGGDGGKGGDIIIVADENTDTLSDFQSTKVFTAKHGKNGSGQKRGGVGAEDRILRVPPGTMITDTSEKGKPVLLADLRTPGDQIIVAHGGRGGYGNWHFRTSTRQAPDFAELGEPGEHKTLKLELKLVADIGIIGYPSVGKSSLITAVSAARPKIAEYHFTTLVPNLGVVHVFDREFVLCDVPGLIEGAHEGKGLGVTFLRHIERCGILIHLLDVSNEDIVKDYRAIRKELELYSPTLAKKPEFVVLNKSDIVNFDTAIWEKSLKKAKIKVFAAISASAHRGTKELMEKLLPYVLAEREKRKEEEILTSDPPLSPDELPVLQPQLLSLRMGAYRIEKRNADTIIITGKRLEQFTKMTNFSSAGARQRFYDVLDRIGLLRAISSASQKGVTEVYIGTTKVDKYL